MSYKINKKIRDNEKLRSGFNELALKTFELSFEDWYKAGYWTDRYIPYVMHDGDHVLANVSVNLMDFVWQGKHRRYVQIGTVMTDEEHRNKGFARALMESVLEDWKERCHGMYLFANETVLAFYPKFGFQQEREFQCSLRITGQPGCVRKLDMRNCRDREIFRQRFASSNPFSALPMTENEGLLMFYCASFMKDCVFYCRDYDAVVIGMQDRETFFCYDIYGGHGYTMSEIVSIAAEANTKQVIFGFAVKDAGKCRIEQTQSEDTLFLLKDKENIFQGHNLMFPVLSHA